MADDRRIWRGLALAGAIAAPGVAEGQSMAGPAGAGVVARDDAAGARVLAALRMNPVTAPYRYSIGRRNGRVVLSGRVATKVVHDAAVEAAGAAAGGAIEDNLVIDTAEVYRSGVGPGLAGRAVNGSTPYVYPPPLFGYYDDPFFGFEPPVIAYPPYWNAITARRLDPPGSMMARGPMPGQGQGQGPPPAPVPSSATGPGMPAARATSGGTPRDTVEATIDPRGVAVLRGTVPTLAEKIAVGQKIAGSPGVSEVVNLIETRDAPTAEGPAPGAGLGPAPAGPRSRDVPPPSPEAERPPEGTPIPAMAAAAADPARAAAPAGGVDEALTTRLQQAIARHPGLGPLPLRVSGRGGVAYLAGKVPSVLEAMGAYRAVQQAPGVRSVSDAMEFPVPVDGRPNPLIDSGAPAEDVEPYLTAQVRRQVGDAAHVDSVRVSGASLSIRGTVAAAESPRVGAIIRSMPLLRGYRVDLDLRPE